MKRTFGAPLFMLMACVALAITASNDVCIAEQYAITDLGTLGGTYSAAFGINASGQVAGYSATLEGRNHAFFYDGTMHDLGTLGGQSSAAWGINDNGQIVGDSQQGNGAIRAFYYDGTMHDLSTLGGESPNFANAINTSGQIVGSSDLGTMSFNEMHAFLYDGSMHDLGTLGGNYSTAFGINANGQIVGEADTLDTENIGSLRHAFFYDGTMHDLGTLGGSNSAAFGINANGQIVGEADTLDTENIGSLRHAFCYDGTMHDLGTLGGNNSSAKGVNASGQIVGAADTTDINALRHAFLYTTGTMVDLNTLISPMSGWLLIEATGINNVGQITGTGFIGDEAHAFLLTPVPEPSTFILAALGGLALPCLASRRQRMIGLRR